MAVAHPPMRRAAADPPAVVAVVAADRAVGAGSLAKGSRLPAGKDNPVRASRAKARVSHAAAAITNQICGFIYIEPFPP